MNSNLTPSPEEPSEIIASPSSKKVVVSAEVLNEAVMQLRKLTELRQRESERQERAIAQMQSSLKRQRILSRYVVICCLLVVVVSGGIAYLVYQSSRNEIATARSLVTVDQRLSAASQTIAEETQKQISTLDGVRTEVMTAREEQSSLIQKVEEQLGAVRAERDNVRGEVRTMLDEKTRQFTEREIELRAERDAIEAAKIRSKEEQKELIQQTIERLNAMSASLSTEKPAAAAVEPAVPAATDADINTVVESVDAMEQPVPVEEAPVVEPPSAQ